MSITTSNTNNAAIIMDYLAEYDAPAPDDMEQFDGHLNLIYGNARDAVQCYAIAQELRLPLQPLNSVSWAPWQMDDEETYFVAFQYLVAS